MHIDWFTFAAQIVNFFVLVLILRHVLYHPILEALEARRRTVENAVSEAATARETAERDRKALSEERDAYGHQKAELQKRLAEEMETERARLLDAARRELEELSTGWKRRIADEKASAGRLLAELAGNELLSITRQMMRDLSDSELDAAMVRTFLRRWHETPPAELKHHHELLQDGRNTIRIRTSAALSDKLRDEISQIVSGDLGIAELATSAISRLHYEVAPELIGGIEICIGDRRIAWTFAEYLSTLEERLHAILEEHMA